MNKTAQLVKLNKQLRKFGKKTGDEVVYALVELTDCMLFCGDTGISFGYDRLGIDVNNLRIHIMDRETGEVLLILGPSGYIRKLREPNLIELRDELKYHPVGDNLTAALSTILSSMIEAGPGGISISYRNIGINIIDNLIEVINIRKSVSIFSLEAL
jgi:hypothetical protein